MFISQQQLAHLLEPADYFDPQRHADEVNQLLRPAWQIVGGASEFPRDGDFRTFDLLGTPILLRRIEGEVHAFLNVCAHRHCRLTDAQRGNQPALKCQYHGWEYKADGHTSHIPEARAFRPFDRETAALRKFPLERRGDVLFLSLHPNPPPLAEVLGKFDAECRDWFSEPYRFAGAFSLACQANWKVNVENSVESYHVGCVHHKTFGITPPEELCRHEMEPGSTRFQVEETDPRRGRLQRWAIRSLGLPVTPYYTHHLVYPHLMFSGTDAVRLAYTVIPTSATTCLQRVWVYTPHGPRRNPLAWWLRTYLKWFAPREAERILREDEGIVAAVQAGLQSSPFRGVIGTREERIYAFQQYVLNTRSSTSNQQ